MKGILIDDETGDLMIRGGALVIGNCDADVSQHIIQAWQGSFKEVPMLGGNVDKMRNGAIDPFWQGEMTKQLRSEHVNVKRLDVSEAGIELEIN